MQIVSFIWNGEEYPISDIRDDYQEGTFYPIRLYRFYEAEFLIQGSTNCASFLDVILPFYNGFGGERFKPKFLDFLEDVYTGYTDYHRQLVLRNTSKAYIMNVRTSEIKSHDFRDYDTDYNHQRDIIISGECMHSLGSYFNSEEEFIDAKEKLIEKFTKQFIK